MILLTRCCSSTSSRTYRQQRTLDLLSGSTAPLYGEQHNGGAHHHHHALLKRYEYVVAHQRALERTVNSIHLTSLAAPQQPSMESSMMAAPIATTTPTDAMNMLLLINVLENARHVHIQSPTANAIAPPP